MQFLRSRIAIPLMVSLLAVALTLSSAFGQASANKAQLAGTVLDPNGAAVPNADIKIRNVATGFSRELKSNEAGQYRAVALDPGTYDVTCEFQGFAPSKLSNVVLTVGSAVTVDITLSVQATATTIEVGETMTSDVMPAPSATLNSRAIENLPINGRRFQDFAQLTPTVAVTDGTRGQLSMAGQRGVNSNVMLDGGDYNQPFFGGIRGGERSNSIITVPQSAVQEFQVVTTGYSAEYGRSTGGVMNTITKSGGNDMHGEAFYQIRHRALSAQNPIPINLPVGGLQKVTPSENLQQYGGSVGGSIIKDRLFWLGAFEQQNAKTPRQVFFPALSTFTPSANTQEAVNYFKKQEAPFDQSNRAMAAMGRADYQFAKGHRLTTRYNFSDSNERNAVSVGGDLNPFSNSALSNEGQEKDRLHNGALQYTHLLSPVLVNDFRFLGSAELRPRLANSNLPTLNAGLVGLTGTRNFLPTTQSDKRWQFADALSWTAGKHTIKIGGDYNYITASQSFGFSQFGGFYLTGGTLEQQLDAMGSGGAIQRFDTTLARYEKQIGNTLAAFNMQQIAVFAQDSFRVHKRLSLDFGIRYEAQVNPAVEANNASLINRVQAVQFPIGARLNPTYIPNSASQVMPRVGFAWTPFEDGGRTVVRGHFGVFYASTPLLSFAGPNNNFRTPPGDVRISLNSTAGRTIYRAFNAAGLDLNAVSLDNLPNIPLDTVLKASSFLLTGSTAGAAADPFLNASVLAVANDFANPRSMQGGLGFDTELAKNFVVGAQFNYVNTVHLQRNRDYNVPAPVISPTDQSLRPNFRVVSVGGGLPTILRPVSTLSNVTIRESSARQMYRAATLSAQYRRSKLQFQAFYTLAENFSDDDSERDSSGFTYTNSFDLRPEYNYSYLDIRHAFTSNAIYSLPWGFDIAGLYRFRTGLPMTAVAGVDLNQDGNNFSAPGGFSSAPTDRPYHTAGIPFLRNAYRNRNFQTFDLRVMKNFRIKERMRVQLSAEMFNLFNVANVAFSGQANIYGPGFQANGTYAPVDSRFQRLYRPADGQYDSLTTSQQGKPFQMQFGARFFF